MLVFNMTSENCVKFKCYFYLPTCGREIRKFSVDRDVVSNFTYLKEKLMMSYPEFSAYSNIRVAWRDKDGDLITLGSDEELMIALTEMQLHDGEFKLHVIVKEPNNIEQMNHSGVACDSCDGPVNGFRYKCLECADFDLCSKCEQRCQHPEHFFVRIPTPSTFDGFGKAVSGWLRKSQLESHPERHGIRKKCRRSRGTSPARCFRMKKLKTGKFARKMNKRFHKYGNRRGDKFCPMKEGRTLVDMLANVGLYEREETGPAASAEPSQASQQPSTSQPRQCKPPEDLVSLIRTAISSFLDPSGFSVPTEKQTNGEQRENEGMETEDSARGSNFSANGFNHDDIHSVRSGSSNHSAPATAPGSSGLPNPHQASSQSPNQESSTAAGNQPSGQPNRTSPSLTNWVLVEPLVTAAKSAAEAAAGMVIAQANIPSQAPIPMPAPLLPQPSMTPGVPQAQAPPSFINEGMQQPPLAAQPAQPAQGAQIFPPPPPPHIPTSPPFTLPMQRPPAPRNPVPVRGPFFPAQGNDSSIDQALSQMLAMGFNNEGDWLRQALVSRNGNISQVLDLLSPNRKL